MSDEEMALLSAKVANLEDTILAAFNELQIVKSQQLALQARRTSIHVQQTADHLHPYPMTIHLIPPELLIQIFSFVVHGADRLSSPQDAQDAFRSAVAVSHVCRQWRDTVLHTSSIWAYIQFGRNLRGVRTCLGRSKTQPLTIVRAPPGKRYPTLPEKNVAMKSHLESTSSRWMNIHWTSSDITMRHILSELNRVSSFPFLSVLELVVDERRLIGPRYIPFVPDWAEDGNNRFPKLEHMKLTQVPPSDLPPVTTPAVRTLYLHFPHKQQAESREWLHLLRMSGLCALLYRAPNLEELVIDDSVILMDIRLRPFDEPQDDSPVAPGFRQTNLSISPLRMSNLTRFQWDFAPARDLWRLFYFVRMPALRQLDLVLDRSDERWLQVRGGLVSAIGDIQPIGELLTHPVVRFEQLEDLRVECLDTDGLSTAFRKLEFPNLKTLALTFVELNVPLFNKYYNYNRAAQGPEITSQLPRAESIFRDPRMPNLLSLELSNFHLDIPYTKGTLQYMPALQRLYLDSCTNAGSVVSMLDSRAGEEEWLCPALEHLVLRSCHDVDEAQLYQVARSRKQAAMGIAEVGAKKRALKPLRTRKRVASGGGDSSSANQAGSESPVKQIPQPQPSPGGWSSHQRKKPRTVKTICVEGCGGFSDNILMRELRGEVTDEVMFIPVAVDTGTD